MKNNPFDFFLNQLENNLPEPLKPFQQEVKETAKRVISSKMSSFDLVSRAEFEAQAKRLADAEARAANLEARLAAIEAARSP